MTKLLPAGFCDLIGQEAKINYEITTSIISDFFKSGFNMVKTPLVEYEETLDNFQKLNEKSFRISDISGGKNLVFRNDITVQIARLVSTRLNSETLPLKLCYLGDVLKVDSKDLNSDRQLTQAGIEIVGDGSNKSVYEVLEVTLASLKNAKAGNLVIEFSLPKLLDLLIGELGLKDSSELISFIEQKNISKIKEFGGKYGDILVDLILEIKDLTKIRTALEGLKINNDLKIKIDNLLVIVDKITKEHPDVTVLTNIFSEGEFLYHKDVGFTIFSQKSLSPIARGGKYEINDNLVAVGSTIYVNSLRNILA